MDNLDVLKTAANGNETLLAMLTSNVIDHMVFNLTRHTDGTVSFEEIHDFWHHNSYEKMAKDEQCLYDLYHDFRNDTNAAKSLLALAMAEEPATFTLSQYEELQKKQAKFDPETEHNLNQVHSYLEFRGILTDEQAEFLKSYATERTAQIYRGKTTFEQYFVNTKAAKLESGMTCTGWGENDQLTGFRILQTDEKGFVYAVSNDSYGFVVIANCEPIKAKEGIIPPKFQEMFDSNYDAAIERAEKQKADRLGIRGKALEAAEKAHDKLAKKAAAKKMTIEEYQEWLEDYRKQREARAKNYKEFEGIDLTSKEAIAAAGEQLSAMDLSKAQHRKANRMLEEAQEALKAAETEAPKKGKGGRKPKAAKA